MLSGLLAIGALTACAKREATRGHDSPSSAAESTDRRESASAMQHHAARKPTAPTPVAAPPGGNRSGMSHYTLSVPQRVDPLPPELQEVSGLTELSKIEVAMVQDEEGTVFIYNLDSRQVTKRIPFGPPGDYEGLARVGSTLYALRSDATLFEIANYASTPAVKSHALDLSTADNEGLCADPERNRLLIAPKSRWGKGKSTKHHRPVFAFDLGVREVLSRPAYVLDTEAVADYAEATQQPLPTKETKRGKARSALRLLPASLAIHPRTSDVFLLSAIDRMLVSFDAQGRVTGAQQLDEGLFFQPEGITFLDDATMVITSEGAKSRPPALLVYSWQDQSQPQ